MSRHDDVLAAIDGALADKEFPDAMRWSPEPETVDAPHPFDGEYVTVGPEHSDPSQWLAEYDAEHVTPGGMYRDSGALPAEFLRYMEQQIVASLQVPPPVVYTSTPAEPLERMRALSRVLDRAERRGPTADLLIFDEAFLVDPAHREEVRRRQREAAERLGRTLGDWITDATLAFGRAVQSAGEIIGSALASLAPPKPPAHDQDVMARALQLRQTRNTGPDRQVQHRPRPRRHP